MSKKPPANEAVPPEELSLNHYFQKCAEDTMPMTLYSVELILKKVEDDITFKEVDKKKKPFAVKLTLSQSFKASVGSVLKPDPRGDDSLADVETAELEPTPAVLDNCTSNQKTIKLTKEIEIPSLNYNESVSHRSSPRSSQGTRFIKNIIKKKIDAEIASATSKFVRRNHNQMITIEEEHDCLEPIRSGCP
jgi:hypothetical protein